MGIFKNITKTLKQAAPVIGSAIGMYYGGSFGAALGSGLGSLAAGRSTEEALRNAALTGATSYALGGKDFGREGEFTTKGSPFASPQKFGSGEFADTNVIDSVPVNKTGSFLTSPMGIASLGLGAAALGGLDEEEEKQPGRRQPDPVGRSRLGIGLIGDKAYNLDDDEERKQYFEDLREKQGVYPTKFSRGGLNALGSQIANQITQPIQGKMSQIGPFLEEVKSNAEQKFGVSLNGQGGGMGLDQLGGVNQLGGGLVGQPATIGSGMNQLGRPLPTQDTSSLFDQMQNRFGDQTQQAAQKDYSASGARPAYMPVDEDGDGVDQFGAKMETNPFAGMTEEEGNKLLSDTFGQGVTQSIGGSSPFGSGQSRLGGLGAMSRLFMNTGGEVSGPGTGTSDSVPARLSDGEFVLTAKAVRGAGGGDRDLGAARMYDMMSKLERVA